MTATERARQIASGLIARRYIHRKELRDMFLDEDLMAEVERNLATVGLELATHIYAEYVSVKVVREMEPHVFSDGKGGYRASNTGLSRGALALLTIIWAKIILPKRQMQIERRTPEDNGQDSLWQQRKPIPVEENMVTLDDKALLADFAAKFGGKTLFYRYLAELARAEFIVRREGKIYEGPLLDVVVDYGVVAQRIINGALGEMLGFNDESSEEIKE